MQLLWTRELVPLAGMRGEFWKLRHQVEVRARVFVIYQFEAITF